MGENLGFLGKNLDLKNDPQIYRISPKNPQLPKHASKIV
jgi:hypothetical protein